MLRRFPPCFLGVFLLALAGCGRYVAIPWADPPGASVSVDALGERFSAALGQEVRRSLKSEPPSRREERTKLSGQDTRLKVVLGAFPEARTGTRTEFSRQIEDALRKALSRSDIFAAVDGGTGVSWQEAGIGRLPAVESGGNEDAFGDSIFEVVGGVEEILSLRQLVGEDTVELREKLSRDLDGDHPMRGLWPKIRDGRYGEGSAVYAASLMDADAAVFGAYALGPERVRVWAAVVLNGPKRTRYFRRELSDVFGEPERLTVARAYLAHARDHIPRGGVPEAWLATPLPPRPRSQPRQPRFWASTGFGVVLEGMSAEGRKKRLRGGEILGSDTYVVGRLSAVAPRYLYAFSIDKTGRAKEVFGDPIRRGRAARVAPGKSSFFAARLLPPGRSYRLYFVSSGKPFAGEEVVNAARERLGLPRRGGEGGFGAPVRPWFVPPGQERLALDDGWSQRVFWFFKRGTN